MNKQTRKEGTNERITSLVLKRESFHAKMFHWTNNSSVIGKKICWTKLLTTQLWNYQIKKSIQNQYTTCIALITEDSFSICENFFLHMNKQQYFQRMMESWNDIKRSKFEDRTYIGASITRVLLLNSISHHCLLSSTNSPTKSAIQHTLTLILADCYQTSHIVCYECWATKKTFVGW